MKMRKILITALVSIVGVVSAAPVTAQDSTEIGTEAPASAETLAGAEEEPLALDDLEVTAEGFTLQQEIGLRVIRSAFGKSKSPRFEDRDEWVCWIDKQVGSNFNYLHCARNGDIWALQRSNGIDAPTIPAGGYGKILVSERPVNRWKLKQALASLEGSEDYDREFLQKVLSGEQPLRDPPSEEELERFARAYREVTRLSVRGTSEARQIRAIEAQGLTLARYNHIATLAEEYASVKGEIAALLDD